MWNWICKKKNLWIVLTHQCCTACRSACRFLVDLVNLVDLHVECSADLLVDLCVDLNVDLHVELVASLTEDLYLSYESCSCLFLKMSVTALPKGVSVLSDSQFCISETVLY